MKLKELIKLDPSKLPLSGGTMTGKLNLNAGLDSTVGSTNIPWTYSMTVPFFGIYTGEGRTYEMLSTLTQIVAFDYQRTGYSPQASTLFQTSGWNTLLTQGSSGDLLQIQPNKYNIEVSSPTTTTDLYRGLLGGNPAGANFINMLTGEGVKFKVDSFGNIFPAGAYIHPRGTIGIYENLITYSNTFTDASWVAGSGATVTDGAVTSPDGKPNNAATIVWGTGNKIIKKTVTGQIAANNTFSIQGWHKRTGGDSVLRIALTDSTESETSTIYSLGLNDEVDKWLFFSFNYTYNGTATGAPVIKLYYTSTTTMTSEIFGLQVNSGTKVLGYTPTQSFPISRKYGMIANGNFRLSSDSNETNMEISKSINQGSIELLSITDENNTKQLFVDSNFNISMLNNIKSIYGSSLNAEIYYDGTDLKIDSASIGSGTIDFVSQVPTPLTTEVLSEYINIKIGGITKKLAIVA